MQAPDGAVLRPESGEIYLEARTSDDVPPPPHRTRLTLSSSPSRLLWIAAALAAVAACGDGDAGPGPELPFAGVSEVAGSDLEEWSLLAVPRDGGPAEARSVSDPGRVVWTGETTLPAANSLHLLEGPVLVLRTPSGEVHRYDPRTDELSQIGRAGEDAVWAASGRDGVLADPEGALLHVGPEGAWRYEVDGRPTWAAPVADGGVAVLVDRGDESPALWLVRRGTEGPAARSDVTVRAPALVTGWGRRMAAVSPGGETLRFVAVPSLSDAGEVALDGPVGALAASPSSHEIYAGVGAPPRVLRVSRFTSEVGTLVETDREIRALRSATLGSALLVDDGGEPLWVPVDGSGSRRLEGDWRADLPLVAPDGRVLLALDGGLALWDPAEGSGADPVDVPPGLWWAAVQWNPAPPSVVSDRVEAESVAAATDTEGEGAEGPPGARPPADSLVPEEEPVAAGDPAGDEEDGERDVGEADSPPAGDLTPGFYAVVAAAREEDGVRRLLDRLSEAGYPTELQRHRDDAGQLWFRGLVGGYGSREEAEAAARQLSRERDVDPWVTEIRAGAEAREAFP